MLIAAQRGLPRSTSFAQGLHPRCDQSGDRYIEYLACQTGKNNSPTVLLWGDSFAMHLAPGIMSSLPDEVGFRQATKSACAPILGLAQLSKHTLEWAEECVRFNTSVLNLLSEHDEIRYVVIASSWTQILSPQAKLLASDRGVGVLPIDLVRAHIEDTIRAIRTLGKTPILIGPTPIASYDVGACNERLLRTLPILHPGGCDPQLAEIEDSVKTAVTELRYVASRTETMLLLPTEHLCSSGHCASMIEGRNLYRDAGHLTPDGAIYVAREIKLKNALGYDGNAP